MDKKEIAVFLGAFTEPAFYAVDGIVREVNDSAEGAGICPGVPLSEILSEVPERCPGTAAVSHVRLLGLSVRLRCSSLGQNRMLLVQEKPARSEAVSIPAAVCRIREAEQDLSTALDLIADESDAGVQDRRTHSALARRSLYRLERVALRLEWFYQLSEGTFRLERRLADIPALFRSLCESANDLLQYRGQLLEQDESLDKSWLGSIDERLIQMIFWELVSRLSAGSSGDLCISLDRSPDGNLQMLLTASGFSGGLPSQAEALSRTDDPADFSAWAEDILDLGAASLAAKLHGGRLLLSAGQNGTIRALLSLEAKAESGNTLNAPSADILHGLNSGLVMLSDLLPAEVFDF